MIQVTDLVKTFDGFTALDRLNLHVKKGSVYGLVGVNGSGKTTAIKHLAGIYKQDAGTVLIGGQPVFDSTSVKARVGYIPDELFFFRSYTVGGLAVFYKHMYRKWDSRFFDALLGSFHLEKNLRLNKLSKGMQKQAMFAYVLSIKPDVLILDEPVDGLDPMARRQAMSAVLADVAERAMTVLISSHNLKEMEGVCDTVGIMRQGRMILERGLDDLKTDVHKVQAVFPPDTVVNLDDLTVLHREKLGSVDLLIIRGQETEVIDRLKRLRPLVLDVLPLTLEEIFMYENEGAGGERLD